MADDKKNIKLDDLDNVTGGISIPLGSAMVNKNDGSITNNAPMINNGPCINNARLINKNGTISND